MNVVYHRHSPLFLPIVLLIILYGLLKSIFPEIKMVCKHLSLGMIIDTDGLSMRHAYECRLACGYELIQLRPVTIHHRPQ